MIRHAIFYYRCYFAAAMSADVDAAAAAERFDTRPPRRRHVTFTMNAMSLTPCSSFIFSATPSFAPLFICRITLSPYAFFFSFFFAFRAFTPQRRAFTRRRCLSCFMPAAAHHACCLYAETYHERPRRRCRCRRLEQMPYADAFSA